MSNTIAPTVFYRTLNVEGLERRVEGVIFHQKKKSGTRRLGEDRR
jgi:hypothetical protein